MASLSPVITAILDTIAPRRCVCCGTYDAFLCTPCHTAILRAAAAQQHCHACKKAPTTYGELCATCRGTTPLRSIAVGCDPMHRAVILRAIAQYKYHYARCLRAPLGAILLTACLRIPTPDYIVPVPLHPLRLRMRTFNQAEDLARYIASRITPGVTHAVRCDILQRTRFTMAQARRPSRTAREKNVRGAFHIATPPRVRDAHILLIDDVATSGATLRACADALHDAGARRIDAAVIVRD